MIHYQIRSLRRDSMKIFVHKAILIKIIICKHAVLGNQWYFAGLHEVQLVYPYKVFHLESPLLMT